MKKNVFTVLLSIVTVGILICLFFIYNAIFIEKNTETLPLYIVGISVFAGFMVVLLILNLKNKKK